MNFLVKFRRRIAEEFVCTQIGHISRGLICNDGMILKHRHHTVKNMAQAFAAGIDYASLFEDRQQFRSFFQCLCGAFANGTPNINGVIIDLRGCFSLLTCHTGDGQDSPLCWLHNSLVCCLNAHSQGIGQFGTADFLHPFYTLGKSTEQKGEDHAGVPSRTAQKSGSRFVRNFTRAAFRVFKLPCGSAHCHTHICSSIAVWHRKNI